MFGFVISDLKNRRVPNFFSIKYLFAFWSAVLDPAFWISEFSALIHNQRPQKLLHYKFQVHLTEEKMLASKG